MTVLTVLGADFSLQDSTNTTSITLVFRQGSNRASVESTQCALVDAHEIAECRNEVYFSMAITSTRPQLKLQQPLTATVSIRDSNTTCTCPVAGIKPMPVLMWIHLCSPIVESPATSDGNMESLYFTLLVAASALVVLLSCVQLLVLTVFCHYCRRQRHMHKGYTSTLECRCAKMYIVVFASAQHNMTNVC